MNDQDTKAQGSPQRPRPKNLAERCDYIAGAVKRLRRRLVKIDRKSATPEDYRDALMLLSSISKNISAMVAPAKSFTPKGG